MAANLAEAATTHRFPAIFFRFPRLLVLVHWAMRATTLRVWYVRRAFRGLVRSLPDGFTLVDAGCGHGDYVLPAARRHRRGRFVGVDKIEDNVRVCENYARARGLENARFVQARVEAFDPGEAVDAVACIGVLELIEDDRGALARFYEMLRPGGTLLLYEPVFHRRILPFFEPVLARYFRPYHVVQHRQHGYTPDEVLARLREAGFTVASVEYTFGTAGKLYYELYTLLMFTVLSAHWIWYPVLVPLFAAYLPLFWLLMAIDFFGRRTTGNGMLVFAHRPGDLAKKD